MPKVSVIIPTYNRGSFVIHAIESVLAQTFKDYEIIVVDDGSADNTRELVKKYGDKVRYIHQKNQGPSAARNTGIRHAKGKYIAFCDSDDRFLPDKLQKQMDYIKRHPDCRFLYTWYYNVDAEGRRTKLRKPTKCKGREHLQYCLFTRRFTIRTSTVLIHKKCFQKVGMFNEKYLYSQDWDMWLRLASRYRGDCLQEPLSEYLLHGNNRSSLSVKTYHPEIIKSTLKLYGWSNKKLKKLEKKYGIKRRKH
ncbi:glycosyltransferase family 2 protein [Effusibacillus lacus]|uniref:Glycosyl transferase n=1 Tax=Effusibacillus lacus TaxID=1348429 RepID=A0A292YSV9_9BACL|nr:glycosyltransferase [Effusibacillus lacus]TCS73502.1 glycosyl transferase family 2 [Effusibacillus lacus]GAX92001.1 glycosyl transferase [Effusibacillus lacus]